LGGTRTRLPIAFILRIKSNMWTLTQFNQIKRSGMKKEGMGKGFNNGGKIKICIFLKDFDQSLCYFSEDRLVKVCLSVLSWSFFWFLRCQKVINLKIQINIALKGSKNIILFRISTVWGSFFRYLIPLSLYLVQFDDVSPNLSPYFQINSVSKHQKFTLLTNKTP
jgi:hypothetical protein